MNRKRGGVLGVVIVFAILFFIIVVGLPVLINILTGESLVAGVLANIVMGVLSILFVAIVLGFIPYVTTLIAIHERNRRLNWGDGTRE